MKVLKLGGGTVTPLCDYMLNHGILSTKWVKWIGCELYHKLLKIQKIYFHKYI